MTTKKKSAAAATLKPAAAPKPLPRLLAITVDNGETWDHVAARAGVGPDALFEANRAVVGSSRDRALPGTPLEVPQEG